MTINRPSNPLYKAILRYKHENIFILVFTLLLVFIYSLTLAPSVVQIDSGELATVQSLAGIAHPTGYPLFTVLGYIFLKIPLTQSKIIQSNWLSLVWCVLGIFFFLKSIYLCLENIESPLPDRPTQKKHQKSYKSKARAKSVQYPIHINMIACIGGGAFLAFSKTYWMQATSVEVYSLHIVLISIAVTVLIKSSIAETSSPKSWTWVALALALGFSNHMTTLLILPGTVYLFIKKEGFKRSTWKSALMSTAVFVGVLCLVYLYLPLRASGNPVLNWGNPVRWENLVRHVSGKQYQVWLFSSSKAAMKNLNTFFHNFPFEFYWVGLLLGFIGLYSSFIKMPRLAVFFVITFFSTVLYAINYDIHDLESYFLLAYFVFAFWITFGIRWILVKIRKKPLALLFFGLVTFGILYEAISNFSKNDQSDLYVFEDYTKQALKSLPGEAVLLSYQWDYLISPAYYFQFVEGFRRDVAIVDKELLRRSWYFDQMKNNYPEVLGKLEPEIASFIAALMPFERGEEYNSSILEKRYRGLIARLIETNVGDRDVFIAPELVEGEFRRGELYLPEGQKLVPDLFFFRVVSTDAYVPIKMEDVSIRFPKKNNRYANIIKNFVSKMFIWRASYEIQHGKIENAKKLKGILIHHFPGLQLPQVLTNL